ncbi:MAG TPA: type II toxin-antitoxin system prevent-host-death family antitoxin [Candidatus Dormibacteraeota bacterium]|nr:type II toxin-antitoxin system prevent-host-death family antitoxin [Candidatus Dormibacteraeota bacterium]
MESTIRSHVGVRELKAHLSAYLDQVRRGHPLVVTEHGRPIVEIVPYGGTSKLAELIGAGRARAPRASARSLPEPIDATGSVSDIVLEQRR